MQQLTYAGESAVSNLAQRYGVSIDAVKTLLMAVNNGAGSMAQFYHPDLGGGGQWMRGGMTMVGDMFNHGLQATVNGLCNELSSLLANQQVFLPVPQGSGFGNMSGSNWWPSELGQPSSSGGQNDSRYAYFPSARRLAVSRGGQVSIYDTLDHDIGGVQQQQGGPSGSQSFSSQFGTFTVESLPLVTGDQPAQAVQPAWQPEPSYYEPAYQAPQQNAYEQPIQSNRSSQTSSGPQTHDEILTALDRLGTLHQRGVLSDNEFQSKKSELLARL